MEALEKYKSFYDETMKIIKAQEEATDEEKADLYARADQIEEEMKDAVKKSDRKEYQELAAERNFIYDRVEFLENQEKSEEQEKIKNEAVVLRSELMAAATHERAEAVKEIIRLLHEAILKGKEAAEKIGSIHAAVFNLENGIIKGEKMNGSIEHLLVATAPDIKTILNRIKADPAFIGMTWGLTVDPDFNIIKK